MSTTKNEKQKEERELLFQSLYFDAFPGVCKYISKMSGSVEEARDVFQDALLIYFEQTRSGHFRLEQNDRAYLFGISKNLWHKRFGKQKHNLPLDQNSPGLEETLQLIEPPYQEISATRLLRLLSKAGEKCMQLLSAFYYERLDMQEVADRFGFSGARSATVQKFKCLEKVKETVKEKSLCYEDIME